MTTVNISLPEDLQLFIDEQIAGGNYSTASEYIHHLIRQAQQQAERERIETLLLEGVASGESIKVTDEWWEAKRTQ